jgi:hypothetical protein
MDPVNAYFKKFYPPRDALEEVEPRYSMCGFTRPVPGYSNIFPAMTFADGLSLSVQGHWGAYSFPRDDWADEYLLVEIMGPKKADELLAPFERDHNTVGDQMIYPAVPVSVVAAIIEKHGGIVIPQPDLSGDTHAEHR